MTAQRRPELAVLAALTLALLTAVGAEAAIKTRTVIVLPYATGDLGRQEQWIGEGIAQALILGLVQMPALIQIDRERLKRLSRSDAWDDQAALAAARMLGADVAVYGEVRRAGADLSIVPRCVEAQGRAERADRARPRRGGGREPHGAASRPSGGLCPGAEGYPERERERPRAEMGEPDDLAARLRGLRARAGGGVPRRPGRQ